ncbi:MAG: MEDS domain-containing protein [Streptosporangiaceae bacterium]
MDSHARAVLRAGPRDHVVLFYQEAHNDRELTETVGEYVLGALRADEVAIVVGTWEHQLSFARYLVRAGVDLASARARGTYLELDANGILETFVMDSHADPASFWAELTPVIRRAAESGLPVRIFGEMVALLWEAGQIGAAIELEAMWNELAAQFPFSLLCAYSVRSVAGSGQLDQLTEVCRAHSAVAGEPAGLLSR